MIRLCPLDITRLKAEEHLGCFPCHKFLNEGYSLQVFVQAMEEAEKYEETQELPTGFNEDNPPSPQMPATTKKSRPASGKTKAKKAHAPTSRTSKRAAGDSSQR